MAVLLGARNELINIPITKSQTWTPPLNGTAVIHVIGAGGGGEAQDGSSISAAGGGGAGYANKLVTISTGTNWTFVVGARGARAADDADGATGGNSTATDGAIATITANGGVGGSYQNGGTGGTASNGDVNNTGGRGGFSTQSGGNGTGGAVGVLGTGAAGTNATTANMNKANGADSDIMSPSFGNTYGYLSGGGKGGKSLYAQNAQGGNYNVNECDGGFLAGGGACNTNYSAPFMARGGDGGTGAGGGSGHVASGDSVTCVAGAGGEGLIVVMYLTTG
tara:strand:+ start:21 stop:857 length:837 start_codon:yes stop_codon:yes gene_type:complete